MKIAKMFRRHFEYHGGEYPTLEEEQQSCHWCQIRAFSTHTSYPIAIVNDVDDTLLPPTFRFIEQSILREGVEPADEAFRTGCECLDDKECQSHGCHCLQDMAVDDDEAEDVDGDKAMHEGAGDGGKIYVYHGSGKRKECLRGKVLESRHPIYECHAQCACTEECQNRVVERGRKIPLQIFRTDNGRGWGVRSPLPIKRGQYVDKYIGEVLPSSVADTRRLLSTPQKDIYLFALDKFSDAHSLNPLLSAPPFEVDGEFFSGPTRFINHSCEPNLRSFARVGDHADKHLHDLALFAVVDIEAGEELTFDYVDGEEVDERRKGDLTRCLCGSEKCRGFLW